MADVKIVLGLAFGDEGKGSIVHQLARENGDSLVVRFNGGHQAGHTVVQKGIRHVFSTFGSGTLAYRPTQLSRFCTIYPPALHREFSVLCKHGVNPTLYIDPLCMVTTPYDVTADQLSHTGVARNRTVGVGYGKTVQRTEDHVTLYAKDLAHPDVVRIKLGLIAQYYGMRTDRAVEDDFIDYIQQMRNLPAVFVANVIDEFDTLIFEGAQGILLDQYHGFFPYVTRSNTTSKNVYDLINDCHGLEVYMVTRTYLTRHGAGYLPGEGQLSVEHQHPETNKWCEYQGDFRYAPFNKELCNYAIATETAVSKMRPDQRYLVFTHCDEVAPPKESEMKIEDLNILYTGSPEGVMYDSYEEAVQRPETETADAGVADV